MAEVGRTTLRKAMWTFGVAVVVVTAVTLSALRLLLPQMPSYRTEVESWLTHTLGHPVRIGAVSAGLRGLGVALRFSEVTLLDEHRQNPIFSFHEVLVDVDLWRSLLAARPELGRVTLVGVELEVVRERDGSIAVAGMPRAVPSPDSTASPAAEDRSGLRWLLERNYISLADSSVHWRDRTQSDAVLTFSNLRLLVINDGKHHRIGGEGDLPPAFGKSLRFMVEAYGDLLDGAASSGTLYVRSEQLYAASIRALFPPSDMPAVEGTVDSELWVNWRAGSVVSAVGSVQAQAPVLRGAHDRQWRAASARAQFNWRVIPDGWLLNVSRWNLGDDNHTNAALVVRQRGGAEPSLEVATNRVELEPMSHIAAALNALSIEQLETLKGLRLHGRLQDAYLRVQKRGSEELFYLRAQFSDVGFRPWRQIPGAHGLDGIVEVDTRAARLQLHSEGARLDVPGVFRNTLAFETLTGEIAARYRDDGWDIWSDRIEVSSPDIQADGSFHVKVPSRGAPELDLAANFRNGRAAATGRYLPAGVMPPSAVAWLDRAIVDGTVPAGGVVFRGPLDQFPFRKAQGRFEVRFTVENGVLDYAPRWPRLDQVHAEVVFSENSLHIHGHNARTLDAFIDNVRVDIDELSAHKSILQLTGQARGPLATGHAFLTTTPLGETVGRHLRNWKVSGNTEVNLNLTIPLTADAANHVAGSVRLDGAELYPAGAEVDIRDIRGVLNFDRDGLRAQAVAATVMGQAAVMDVTTATDGSISFTATGNTSGAALAERFNVDLLRWLQGPFSWQGTLRLPRRGADTAPELEIRSGLQTVVIDTPYPFGKKLKERREVQVNLRLGGAMIPVNVRYGNQVSAVFALENQNNRWIARRGDVRIGRGNARLPSDDGLHVFARLDKLDVDAWRALLSSPAAGAAASVTATMMLSEVDAEIGEARLWSRRFKDVHVAMVTSPDGWHVDMASDKAVGTITVPQRLDAPIVVDMTRLRVDLIDAVQARLEETLSPDDPRDKRAFQLTAADFRYGDWNLGRLQLNAVRVADGLHYKGVTLGEEPTAIVAEGSWLLTAGVPQSRWHVDLRTRDVGRTLGTFGYANAISGGSGSAKMDLIWTGGPAQFALRRLNGEINIEIERGRLLDVDPGAGRIFGLLSLQALPRRLTLDFSDLFSKGFAFDRIGGDFVVAQGIARTPNMTMEGPAAQVQVTGSVNLDERWYDQHVKVLPNVTSSLPLAVGVAATNPLAGAAAWLAEKILRDPVSDLAQANYRITGSWQNPRVERVSREVKLD